MPANRKTPADPLSAYRAKRSLDRTTEPGARAVQPGSAGGLFVVHQHAARNLHFDLRLEMKGVLTSWAVPKGPSKNPADKRLAVHVEDHPIEYGGFEGNIPAGNYGAGSVMLWDRGTYDVLENLPARDQLARGDFKFRLHGEKLNGDFALVHMKNRGKGNEWLLIKKRDQSAVPDYDIENYAYSVLSGRTQEEIGKNLPARKSKKKTAGATDAVWQSDRPAKGRKAASPQSTAPNPPSPKKKLGSTPAS